MINLEELAICKRRGHEPAAVLSGGGWVSCRKCGMWIRSVSTKEEREE
jgi:hypothetical protein